jgi:TRAP transporter TAXI family solute receptor
MGVNALATAGDAGIGTFAALKGKRIALPASNPPPLATAYLAFGGLTWSDVVRVDAANADAALAAVMANRADAFLAAPAGAQAAALAASPRGIHWIAAPASDAAGWQRLQRVTRWNERATVNAAAGLPAGGSFDGVSTLGVNLVAPADRDADLAYNLTKALFSSYDDYKGSARGIAGCQLSQQTLAGYVPWHEGAIRYFEEVGVWTDAHQKNNDQLMRRQDVLADAWAKAKAAQFANDAEFRAEWRKARASALTAAGLEQ